MRSLHCPNGNARSSFWRYVADLPEAEIAATLGVTHGTVASNLARARESLAAALHDSPTKRCHSDRSRSTGASFHGGRRQRSAADRRRTRSCSPVSGDVACCAPPWRRVVIRREERSHCGCAATTPGVCELSTHPRLSGASPKAGAERIARELLAQGCAAERRRSLHLVRCRLDLARLFESLGSNNRSTRIASGSSASRIGCHVRSQSCPRGARC